MISRERVIELMGNACQLEYGYKLIVKAVNKNDLHAIRMALTRERARLPLELAGEICITSDAKKLEVHILKAACSGIFVEGPDGARKKVLGAEERDNLERRAELMREDGISEEEIAEMLKEAGYES